MLSGIVTDPLMLSQSSADNSGQATREAVAKTQQKKFNIIGAYLGQSSNVDASSSRVGYHSTSNGVLVGMDYALSPATFAGVAFSYARTDADMHGDRGDLSEDTYRVGPYIGCEKDNLRFDGSLTTAYHRFDTDRHIAVPGFDRVADGEHGAYDASAYAALSYDIQVKPFTISPISSLQYTYFRENGFTESGAGSAGLNIDPLNTNSLLSILGARLAATTHVAKVKLLPELFGGWAYESLDSAKDINATFVEAPGVGFSTRESSPDRSRWLVGAGTSIVLSPRLSGYVRYTAELSNSADTHSYGAGLSWRF